MELNWNKALLPSGSRILVGVSGGVDSLALWHSLVHRRHELGVEVAGLHVHHGQRGGVADEDAAFLESLARAWDTPLLVRREAVPELARARRVSLEEAGRLARYRAYRETAAAQGCSHVALAHHAGDQVETILLNMRRGCGLWGLAGMPEQRPLDAAFSPGPQLVRPLLHLPRAELEAYCAAHELTPRCDSTNTDLHYRRNRLRHRILPLLREWDPHLETHLLRLAHQARGEQELLLPQARQWLHEQSHPAPPGAESMVLELDAVQLADLPEALAALVLREAVLQRAGAAEPGWEHIQAMLAALRDPSQPQAGDLPGGRWRWRRTPHTWRMEPQKSPRAIPVPEERMLPGPVGTLEALGAAFSWRRESPPGPLPPRDAAAPGMEALLDAAALHGHLRLRTPRRGDRLHPLGAPGSRLLSDLFQQKRVPPARRVYWPLLADDEGIVWVVGLVVAERARITPASREALRLRARWLADPTPGEKARMV